MKRLPLYHIGNVPHRLVSPPTVPKTKKIQRILSDDIYPSPPCFLRNVPLLRLRSLFQSWDTMHKEGHHGGGLEKSLAESTAPSIPLRHVMSRIYVVFVLTVSTTSTPA
uniref:Uncharacterized protein n=1 Tax=Steinernema glaseri TaxID=37863 RepID=A0A1I7ZBJ9_9BILA